MCEGKGIISRERLILLNESHNVFTEPCHVLANNEGQVTAVNLLIVNNGGANLVTSPLSIRLVRQSVDATNKHGNGSGRDLIDRDQVSGALLTNAEESVIVISPDLETVFFHILGVVQDGLDAHAIGFVVHVHLEAVFVIKFSV